MKKLDLREVQYLLLDIAKSFHQICKKYHIPYYMLGGTMLGAIRHHGFIPWDDDMDFGVPRENYNQLLSILREELPTRYRIITTKEWFSPIAYFKIEDSYTVSIQSEDMRKRAQYGVFIDVFPLDKCTTDLKRLDVIYMKQRWLNAIHSAKFMDYSHYPFSKRLILRLLRVLIPCTPEEWLTHFSRLEREIANTGDDAMVNFSGIYKKREVLDKEIFGSPQLYVFENTQLYGPELYDVFLSHIYGDYMKMPPENKRRVHSLMVYEK